MDTPNRDRPRPAAPGIAPGPKLDDARRWALFLDLDGTLLPIVETPDKARVSNRLRGLVGGLLPRLGGALAIISGRTVAEIDRLLAPLVLPAAGVHGLERRAADGAIRDASPAGTLGLLRAPLAAFAERWPGVIVEDKGRSLALHYRRAPAAESEARALVHALAAGHDDLKALHGKMVFEIKSRHVDKGTAIAAFLKEPPFAGRVPVFIGDDLTDEDGFAFVNAAGGFSIRVGAAGDTAARHRLADVGAVVDWLERLARKVSAEAGGG